MTARRRRNIYPLAISLARWREWRFSRTAAQVYIQVHAQWKRRKPPFVARDSRNLQGVLRDEHGVAAVEFALALPMLAAMFLGGFEVNRYILVHQKVEKVTYTVADVVAQSQSVTESQLDQIFVAAEEIMRPYDFGDDGVVIVTSVSKSGTETSKVRWRYSGGGSLSRNSEVGAVGGTASLPGGLTLNAGDNVIIAEVYYRYHPVLEGTAVSESDIYKTAIFKPRLGALVTTPN